MHHFDHPLAVLVRISDAMPGTAWVFSPGSTGPTYSSHNFRAYFGDAAPGSDLLRWQEALHPEDLQAGLDLIAPRRIDSGYTSLQLRCFRRDTGQYHWFDCCFGREPDDAGCWALRLYDIEEQVRMREALRLEQERKDDFLAMLGHELRNPLSTIANVAQTLGIRAASNPELMPLARMLQRQSTQMVYLVNGLLELSRIARGKMHLRPQVLELQVVIQSVIEDRQVELQSAGLELTLDLQDQRVRVVADRARMIQVIDNLLSNAIRFTPAPGQIDITLRQQDADAVLVIRDTGIGIHADLLPVIFEPFKQGRVHDQGSTAGLGLGLALSKALIDLQGGRIEAASDGPGTGTSLAVRLPLAPADSGTLPSSVPVPIQTVAGSRVLIIDDDTDAAESLSFLLDQMGYATRTAHSGRQALAMLHAQAADLVLCDISMPGMNGFDFIRQLRNDDRLLETVVIALTGYGQPQERQKILAAGFNAHWIKPLDAERLHRLLAGQAFQDQVR